MPTRVAFIDVDIMAFFDEFYLVVDNIFCAFLYKCKVIAPTVRTIF